MLYKGGYWIKILFSVEFYEAITKATGEDRFVFCYALEHFMC